MTKDDFHTPVVAVSLITGFLGSGKTTLLRHLLRDPAMTNAVVIVNEFGDVGLDQHLMGAVGQNIVLLESGCICCSLSGSLAETLEGLHRQRRNGTIPSFDRVLVETTGIADPGPVIHELFDPRALRLGMKLDRVITLVDAASAMATLDRHEISVRQAALASSILVSKTDLVAPEDAERLISRLTAINPGALITRVDNGVTDIHALFDDRQDVAFGDVAFGDGPEAPASHGHATHDHAHHHHHHHDRISTAVVRLTDPISFERFNTWLAYAVDTYGDDLLRIKGILDIEGRSRPVVIHGVQRVFHPAVELAAWPDNDKSSRLVFVLHDISGNELIRSLRRAVASAP